MEDGDLLSIAISFSDEAVTSSQASRDHQSEANFQQQKAKWKPKFEKGQIWKSLRLPVDNPSKPESQNILHAIEELYFFRCYKDSKSLTIKALEGQLQDDFRKVLEDYLERCNSKLSLTKS